MRAPNSTLLGPANGPSTAGPATGLTLPPQGLPLSTLLVVPSLALQKQANQRESRCWVPPQLPCCFHVLICFFPSGRPALVGPSLSVKLDFGHQAFPTHACPFWGPYSSSALTTHATQTNSHAFRDHPRSRRPFHQRSPDLMPAVSATHHLPRAWLLFLACFILISSHAMPGHAIHQIPPSSADPLRSLPLPL